MPRLIKLVLAFALVVVVAGVTATVARALAFDDGKPCPVNPNLLFICPEGAVGAPYSIQLVGRNGCEPHFKYRVANGGLPGGLSMSSSGLISGTPSGAGTALFWVELADIPPSEGGPAWCTNPNKAEREFKIDILSGISINNQSVGPGTLGHAYNVQLAATNVTTLNPPAGSPASNATWSLNSGALPPGVTLAATGLLSGTPTAEGSYQFVVQAALDAKRFDTETLVIVVRDALAIEAPTPFAPQGGVTRWEVGVLFRGKLTATGGSETYTWSLVEGSQLPPGLALAADGTISGRPQEAGAFRATVRLTDSETRTLDYPVTFTVSEKLAISTQLLRPGKVGRLYRAKLSATGGVLPKIWKIKKGPLPRGIRLDRALGVLSGTPTKAGRYRITVEVTDALKVKSTKSFTIVVLGAPKR